MIDDDEDDDDDDHLMMLLLLLTMTTRGFWYGLEVMMKVMVKMMMILLDAIDVLESMRWGTECTVSTIDTTLTHHLH